MQIMKVCKNTPSLSFQRHNPNPNKYPRYDTNSEAPVMQGNVEYTFIAITPRSTLDWSDSTWLGPLYGSNGTV